MRAWLVLALVAVGCEQGDVPEQRTASGSNALSTLTFVTEADAHVTPDAPAQNFGAASLLEVDGSPVREGYLKFSLSGVTGKKVTRAMLRLQLSDGTSDGPAVYRVSNDWSEAAL